MSSIPLAAGCAGVVLGGFIADRVVKKLGVYARLFVLVASQVSRLLFVSSYFKPRLDATFIFPTCLLAKCI